MRKRINTTLDAEMYRKLKILAAELEVDANILLDKGMQFVLEQYGKLDAKAPSK